AINEGITLRWRNGLYLPEPSIGSLNQAAAEAKIDGLFLDLLRRFARQNRTVSPNKSSTYAPAVFENEPEAKVAKVKRNHLAEAMSRLFAADKIKAEDYGPPSKLRTKLVEK